VGVRGRSDAVGGSPMRHVPMPKPCWLFLPAVPPSAIEAAVW
jgi:hypothetical protein